jgi:hypothetical protein
VHTQPATAAAAAAVVQGESNDVPPSLAVRASHRIHFLPPMCVIETVARANHLFRKGWPISASAGRDSCPAMEGAPLMEKPPNALKQRHNQLKHLMQLLDWVAGLPNVACMEDAVLIVEGW